MAFLSNFQPFLVSLKSNKRKRTSIFEKDVIENNGAYSKFTDTKKMSPLEFKRFQEKLLDERKQSRKRFLIVFGCATVLVLAILAYFLFYFNLPEQ
tara:strand:+ start:28152 stop:28439 length:288 start_codon:yes stop_codon:yes gene_type:complete